MIKEQIIHSVIHMQLARMKTKSLSISEIDCFSPNDAKLVDMFQHVWCHHAMTFDLTKQGPDLTDAFCLAV